MARRYSNPDPRHRPHGAGAVLRWGVIDRLLGRRDIRPPGPPAPRVDADLERIRATDGSPRLTWIGHASFLGSLGGHRFLVDPVFSASAGFVVPRFVQPGLVPEQLPRLDALLVTHAHYDHLDDASIRALPRSVPVLCPAGLGRWFSRRGFDRLHEMAWWERVEVNGLEVVFVPARHWSRRRVFDTNRSWWGGFVVSAGGARIYHAGDSAWFGGFAEIGARFPDLLAAILPVGAYEPAWFMEHHHLNPEQAGRAFLATGARHLVPMHWGTFKLTDEPLAEPIRRLRAWWDDARPAAPRRLSIAAVGETLELGNA